MEEKKEIKISLGTTICIFIIVLLVIALGVVYYLKVINDKEGNTQLENKIVETKSKINNGQNVENKSYTPSNSKKENASEEAIYKYSSGDQNATQGNPEVLTIYELNDNEMKFNYHAIWNLEDTMGIAKKTKANLYIYENGKTKIEFALNAEGEDSIKVTEYKNNEISSYINLWK